MTGSGASIIERRKHTRHAVAVRCWLLTGKQTLYLRCHDVSLGGVSLRTDGGLSAPGELQLELELPTGARVRARAEVVWVRPRRGRAAASRQTGDEPGLPRLGARFIEFLEGAAELSSFLEGR